MNKYIDNLYRLFSANDQTMYKAVLEKKDWMFRPLFFRMGFEKVTDEKGKDIYPDIFGLMDQGITFKKPVANDLLFKDNEDKKEAIQKALEDNLRVRYAYEKILDVNKDAHFYVEMDFNKIDKKAYNELVANFFPCIPDVHDLDLFYDPESMLDLLKYPMLGENGKWVFILDKNVLADDKYYMPFIKKIWMNPALLTKEMIETLEEISSRTEIPLEVYHD